MGNRVSPKEIEEVLAEMPEVVEAAVIGVPDEIWGEAIKAFLTTARPGQLTAEDVRSSLPEAIAQLQSAGVRRVPAPIAQDRQRQGGERSIAEYVGEQVIIKVC